MTGHLTTQIKEFLSAAKSSHSYNIPKNPYTWFGVLWGLQVPLATYLLFKSLQSQPFQTQTFLASLSPLMKFGLIIYPLVFCAIFGILGTIRQRKSREIKHLIEELQYTSITDPLSGLYNRRHFLSVFHDNVARANRTTTPISIIFLDIDDFKEINDTHGHSVGDKVIEKLAKILKENGRPYDTPARWGGEEFLMLLPRADEKEAVLISERLRIATEKSLLKEFSFPITISTGVAQHTLTDTIETLIEQADQALYVAKQTGKNKTVAWSIVCSK